jgi:ganglioside GM2 activator
MLRSLVAVALVASSAHAFSWKNCGDTSDPVTVNSLTLSPNPVVLGKNISLSFSATSKVNLTSGGKAEVKIWKKEGIWIEIPCVDNVGSCTYDNLCSLIPDKPCGPILTKNHIPCKCPFNAGTYSIPNPVSIKTKNPGLSWLTSGEFSAQGTVLDDAGHRLACYLVYVTLSETGELTIGESTEQLEDHPSILAQKQRAQAKLNN